MIWRTAAWLLLAGVLDPCLSWVVAPPQLRMKNPRLVVASSLGSSFSIAPCVLGESSAARQLLQAASRSSDVALVEEEWDEEAVDKFDTSRSFDDFEAEFARLSAIASTDQTAVDQATRLFDEMFQAYVVTEDARLNPTIEIYNHFLKILVHEKPGRDKKSLAETIYAKLQDSHDTATPMANAATYVAMMDYWMERGNLQRCIAVFEYATTTKLATSDITIWNKLIQAYGRAGQADDAFNVWQDLQSKTDSMMIEPNENTYLQLLRSQQSRPERLQEIWNMVLTTISNEERTLNLYNAFLLGQTNPKRSEALLYGMIQDGITPNVETIHHVIQTYATTVGLPSLKIEQYFTLLLGSKNKNTVDIPDQTLAVALQALSYHTKCSRKPQKAQSLLARFQQPPTVDALRSAIRSCATIPVDSYAEDKLEAFRIGLGIYENENEANRMRLHGNVLQLAANLLPPGSEKLNVLAKSIFAQAQADGTANAFCIAQFRRAASRAVQLQAFGMDFDDLLQIPPSWSRNDIPTTQT